VARLNTANAFDMQHFLCVHGRKLIGQCQVDRPARFALRNRYRARVVGNSTHDRFLRMFVGRAVSVSITCWGGTYMLMTADFERAHSCFLIATQPLDNGQTLNEAIVFAHRGRVPLARGLWEPLNLIVRRWLTRGFVADEARHLKGIRYNPAALIESDAMMASFLRWAVQLPADEQLRQQVGSLPARVAQAACN
jgi:hypothetical protein